MAVGDNGIAEMDGAMRRRARMMRKFTLLRESIAVEQKQASDRTKPSRATERGDCSARGVPNWLDALVHCLTGGVAGILANALIFPIDVAKTRMQVEMPIFPPGLRGVALVRSFYNGLVLGSLETGAVHASSFLFYDYLKGRWIRRRLGRGLEVRRDSPSRTIYAVSGPIADAKLETSSCLPNAARRRGAESTYRDTPVAWCDRVAWHAARYAPAKSPVDSHPRGKQSWVARGSTGSGL